MAGVQGAGSIPGWAAGVSLGHVKVFLFSRRGSRERKYWSYYMKGALIFFYIDPWRNLHISKEAC
jgi:hypothetical protein